MRKRSGHYFNKLVFSPVTDMTTKAPFALGVRAGAVHHLLGPLQLTEHDVPQFAQLYIIDSMDAQVIARLAALGATGAALHQPILAGLQQMLHDHNTFV